MGQPQIQSVNFFQSRVYGFACAMIAFVVVTSGTRLVSATVTNAGYVVSLLLFVLTLTGLFLPACRRFAQGALIFFVIAIIPVFVLILNLVVIGSVM